MKRFVFLVFLTALFQFAYSNSHRESENVVSEKERRILLQDNYYTIVSRLDSLTKSVASIENKLGNYTIEHIKAELAETKKKVNELENKLAITSHVTVAFKAHLRKSLTVGTNQLIVFDDVQLNIGNAYHHGTFLAPYNGTYIFSVSICTAGGHYVIVDLLRKGSVIGQVTVVGNSLNGCASETTITELQVGDDVIVQHHTVAGDYIYGTATMLNSFTGALLNVL